MLMDLRMPVTDRVEATGRIVQHAVVAGIDRPKIIALTTFKPGPRSGPCRSRRSERVSAQKRGTCIPVGSIRTVHWGYSVIAPGSIHSLFEHAASNAPAAGPDLSVLDVLSVRERDVFLLAAKGLSNGEMAKSLFVSEANIKTHLRGVLNQLELRNRLQLVAFAHERRLLGS